MSRFGAAVLAIGLLLVAAAPANAQPTRGSEPLVAAPDGTEIDGRFLALLIAVEDYKHWPALTAPKRDVEALRKVLVERYLFDESQITVILDPDEQTLDQSLRTFAAKATAKDSILVYFAGHGHLDEQTQRGYWVPVDARENSPRDYISGHDVRDILGSTKARHTAIIADSCFSGTLVAQRSGRRIDDTYYARMYRNRSFEVMTSGANEPVADAGVNHHSPFAYYLIRALEDPERPYVDLVDLYQKVRHGVKLYSPQMPLIGNLRKAPGEGGAFVFIPRKAVSATKTPRVVKRTTASERGAAPAVVPKPVVEPAVPSIGETVDPGPGGLFVGGWTATGIGIAALGAGIGVLAWSSGESADYNALLDDPAALQELGDYDDYKARGEELEGHRLTGWIVTGVGVAAAVTGAVLLVLDGTADGPSEVSTAPLILDGGGGVSVRWTGF